MMFWYGPHAGGVGYALMILAMVVPWLLLIVAGVWFARRTTESPARILARRYARGELDEDEYRHKLAALKGDHRAEPG